MSQTFTDDCYGSTHVAATDLQAFEDNFAALKSSFSGGTAPSNLVAGMVWYDTTKKLPKIYNSASAWFGIMAADTSHKIWVYRNTAPDGWAVDSSVTDSVIALKGGSNAYNVSGGTTGGTWTQPDHTLTTDEIPAHTHTLEYKALSGSGGYYRADPMLFSIADSIDTDWSDASSDVYRVKSGGGTGGAHSHGTTYRPAAAVGTMQYMDI